MNYILIDKQVVQVEMDEWLAWMKQPFAQRIVSRTDINDCQVSTVFLPTDHKSMRGPPVLFETMVFSKEGVGDEMVRYSTWDDAKAGHDAMVAKIETHTKSQNNSAKKN